MNARSIHTIESWQKGRELVNEVYVVTRRAPFNNDFDLKDKIRKTSLSLMSNIDEGFNREFGSAVVTYLQIAKNLAGEVRSQLYVALKQKYITDEDYNRIDALAIDTSKLLYGLINVMKNSP